MKEVTNPESFTEAWVNFRMRFSTMPDRELGPYLADLFPDIVEHIPTASLWALHFDPSLSWRVAAVRVLFAAQANPEILKDWSPGHQGRLPTPVDLMPSLTYGLNAFVDPLLLPASPWIIGMNAVRRGGHAIVMFGRAEAGFVQGEAVETLNLLMPRRSPRTPVPRPNFAPAASDAWIRWWVVRLNVLLGQALDVGRFTGRTESIAQQPNLGFSSASKDCSRPFNPSWPIR